MKRFFGVLLVFAVACGQPELAGSGSQAPGKSAASAVAAAPSVAVGAASAAPTAAASAAPASDAIIGRPIGAEDFRSLVTTLSEPDADFISDNTISNETSYLQVGEILPRVVRPGGVYLGVGPEQNFSYIALTRPAYAYIVDIRRANMIEQLLYKALFDEAGTRAEFLALLISRPYLATGDPGAAGTLAATMAHAELVKAEKTSFDEIHGRLLTRITKGYGFELDERDRHALRKIHKSFAKRGLDLRFALKEQSFRKYPTLRELLAQTCPEGKQLGFLASEAGFRYLQRMERENRIVPIVGDFAGDRALPKLAEHLRHERQTVAAFYVSNVEQYLMTGAVWWKWRRNIEALPTDSDSVFIRAYLDQGQHHPLQLPGHRTATTLQRIADFEAHKGRYPSLLALSSAELIR